LLARVVLLLVQAVLLRLQAQTASPPWVLRPALQAFEVRALRAPQVAVSLRVLPPVETGVNAAPRALIRAQVRAVLAWMLG
jgi:hypothetical protein